MESPAGDAELIAGRLRQTAALGRPPTHLVAPEPLDVEHWMDGDVGHLHRAFDLTQLQLRGGGAIDATLRRLLAPVLEAQTSLNGAAARVVSALLDHVAAQELRLERLEREISELRARCGM
jgi:hypothetical protein